MATCVRKSRAISALLDKMMNPAKVSVPFTAG